MLLLNIPTKIFARCYDSDRLGKPVYDACIVCYNKKLYHITKRKLNEDDRYWKFISETVGEITKKEKEFYLDVKHEYRHPKSNRLDGFFLIKYLL